MQILEQLGQLVLGALPTFFIVLVFFLVMRSAFFRPIERILAERSARIEGARKEAEAAQAAANERVKAYQDVLKKARAEVYSEQETARRGVLEERVKLVREARAQANETIGGEKERIARETVEARRQLEREAEDLGGVIARAVLGRSSPPSARGVR